MDEQQQFFRNEICPFSKHSSVNWAKLTGNEAEILFYIYYREYFHLDKQIATLDQTIAQKESALNTTIYGLFAL